MQSVTPELAAAITAKERQVSVRLSVDWDGDGHGAPGSLDDLSGQVAGIEVDRSLTTDLPDAVRVVEGSAVASLKADLVKGDTSDERRHAAWYFSRSNAASPLAGKERLAREAYLDLVFQTSNGPQSVRRFTGRTRRVPVSAANRTAQLEALDYRERLRNTVSLIPTQGPGNGADGTWVVTQALYACGYNAGPVPRASGCVFWAPMYGSLMPMTPLISSLVTGIGAFVEGPDFNTIYRPVFVPGPFVLAAAAYYNSGAHITPGGDYRISRVGYLSGTSHGPWNGLRGRFELWVKGVPSPSLGEAGSLGRHYLYLSDGSAVLSPPGSHSAVLGVQHDSKLFLRTYNGSTVVHDYVSTVTVPSDGAWHAVGIHFDHTLQTITFKCEASTQTVSTAIVTSELPLQSSFTLRVYGYAPHSDVFVHDVPAVTTWLADTVTTNAVIDPSLLQLQAVYNPDPVEAWGLLDELAAAEQAVSRFDEQGVYRYRTRKRLVETTGQTVQRTLTADASILDLDIDDGVDQVRNIIQVPVTPVTVPQYNGTVYGDTQQRVVPPYSDARFPVSFPNPVLSLLSGGTLGVVATTPTNSISWVVATVNSDGSSDGGTAANATVAFVDSWTTTTAWVVVRNTLGQTVYVTALNIGGVATIVGTPTPVEARDAASITTFGPQPLTMPASKWVQTMDVGQQLATVLLADLKDPHPVISNLRIIGDPRLQLGDRVRIQDPDGVVLDGEYWLGSIKDELSESGGYTQQVSARQATNVFRWGVSRWGGPDRWGSG